MRKVSGANLLHNLEPPLLQNIRHVKISIREQYFRPLNDPGVLIPLCIRAVAGAPGKSIFNMATTPQSSTIPTDIVSGIESAQGFLDATPAEPTESAFQPCDGPGFSVESLLSELTAAFQVALENAIDGEGEELAARVKVRCSDHLFCTR